MPGPGTEPGRRQGPAPHSTQCPTEEERPPPERGRRERHREAVRGLSGALGLGQPDHGAGWERDALAVSFLIKLEMLSASRGTVLLSGRFLLNSLQLTEGYNLLNIVIDFPS